VVKCLLGQDVNLICFTGSSKTGIRYKPSRRKQTNTYCARAWCSAPGIIFEDADVDAVIDTIFTGGLWHVAKCVMV